MPSSYISDRWGPCVLEPQVAMERTGLFAVTTPDWKLLGQLLEDTDGSIEWGWVTTENADQLMIMADDYPFLCFSLIQNSADIHITGNGEITLHETGFQLLYSPYMSFTIRLRKGQTYGWMILRFSEDSFKEIIQITRIQQQVSNFLHPRFLLPQPKIWPASKWHQLAVQVPQQIPHPFLQHLPSAIALRTLIDILSSLHQFAEQARFISLDIAATVYQQKAALLSISHQHLLIDELLSEAGITNKPYFRKCIKGLYGCSIIDLINQYRLQTAASLLLKKEVSIKEIAVRVGYANVYHFTTLFTKLFGLPPKKYQQQFGL